MTEAFTNYAGDQLPTSVLPTSTPATRSATPMRRHSSARTPPSWTTARPTRGSPITAWIKESSTEYTYTSTRTGQDVVNDQHTNVLVRLDGNFPGGTVTLRYQFELDGDTIQRLAIEV